MAAQTSAFTLSSLPPSANNLFAHGMHGRFKTVAYKKWLTDAGWELKAQRPPKVAGRYSMHLSFGIVRQRRDLSNCIKAVEDLAVAHGVVEDDSLAVRIVAEWASEPGVTVTIQQESTS